MIHNTKDKMSIALCNWRDINNPECGGAENVLHRLMRVLSDNKYNIEWISASFNHIHHEDIGIYNIKRIGNKYIYATMIKIRSLFLKNRYDLIIESWGGCFPLFLSNRNRILFIFHLYDIKTILAEYPRKLGIFGYPIGLIFYITIKITPIFYPNAKIITFSKQTEEDLIRNRFNKKNIYVIQEGIDLSKYVLGNVKSEKPGILIVSRLVKYKNVQDAIMAMKIVIKKIPEAELHILGNGDYENHLRNLIKKLGIENNVFLHGFVSDKEKIRFLQESWILIMPSLKEGWATPVIEANACGTPAIVSNGTGIKETVIHGETGYIFPMGNYKIMAGYIERLMVDRDLRESFRKNALVFAKSYSWEKSEDKFYKLIEDLYENKI